MNDASDSCSLLEDAEATGLTPYAHDSVVERVCLLDEDGVPFS